MSNRKKRIKRDEPVARILDLEKVTAILSKVPAIAAEYKVQRIGRIF
jgi:hypothetical protein